MSAKQLTQALTRRNGITASRTKGARWYVGLELAPPVRAAEPTTAIGHRVTGDRR